MGVATKWSWYMVTARVRMVKISSNTGSSVCMVMAAYSLLCMVVTACRVW